MEVKSINPKATQKQIAKALGYSESTKSLPENYLNFRSPHRSSKRRPIGPQKSPNHTASSSSSPGDQLRKTTADLKRVDVTYLNEKFNSEIWIYQYSSSLMINLKR